MEVCSTKVTRRKKLVSRSAALLKVKKFKLIVSQQELEIKSTWQEAEAMRVKEQRSNFGRVSLVSEDMKCE